MVTPCCRHVAAASLFVLFATVPAGAQTPKASEVAKPSAKAPAPSAVPAGPVLPPDYVIGAEDVLTVVFWPDETSYDVLVRPDGRISLPLLNDVDVAGLTPDQAREKLQKGSLKFVEEPVVTVVVKQINSRKVYISGEVGRPGSYPLVGPMRILQLISLAGGFKEFAKSSHIVIVRMDGAQQATYPFNYDDVRNGKNLAQNILLKPGDTVIVP